MSKQKKQSETLAQRKKAQQDFLELKRMQQQTDTEEHVPYQDEIKPKTIWGKFSHFWYYNKIAVLSVIFCVVLISILVAQCTLKPKSDLEIVIYDNRLFSDVYVSKAIEYFESFCHDYNQDGKVTVTVIDCSFQTGVSTGEYQLTKMQKLQSVVATNKKAMLFITSETTYEFLDHIADSEDFLTDFVPLSATAYNNINLDIEYKLPSGLGVSVRNIKGTLFENEEQAIQNREYALDFISRLPN